MIEQIVCYKLHKLDEGCAQEIPAGAVWSFCPACGRPTGHINVVNTDGQFSVPQQKPTTCFLSLRNEGLAPVSVMLELEKPIAGVQLGTKQMRQLIINPRMPQQVELDVPGLVQTAYSLGTLLIRAQDAAFDGDEDPWQERQTRAIRLPLSAHVDTPANVRPLEEIALFREGLPERVITLVNEGMARAEILEVEAPSGYEAVLAGGVTRLGRGERVTCKITRKPSQPAEDGVPLRIRTADGPVLEIKLYSAMSGVIRSLPQAIIGIDFGTAFSTIAFRECRYTSLSDDVEFLTPIGESSPRFPTLVWISKTGDLEFGSEAERSYLDNPGGGYLLREIKTTLRDPSSAKIYPKKLRDQGLRLAQRFYGDNWGEALVTEYLRWIYQVRIMPELRARFSGNEVNARYIFSLPVLDYNIGAQPQYERQIEAMKRCVARAGFPLHANQVEFEFEPVCAALGLLHPPADVTQDKTGEARKETWPVLGTVGYPVGEGTTLAVYDSGGGTTDVVQARVEEKADAEGVRLTLSIEHCLGVGSDAETFGGEWVTEQIEVALNNPGSVVDNENKPATDWYQGPRDFAGLQLIGAREEEEHVITRDTSEKMKFTLAAEDNVGTTDSGGNPTTITPKLLPRLMMPKLQSLAQELDERVFDAEERARTTYYLFVGGNMRIPFVRKWAQTIMQDRTPEYNRRRLLLPDGYLQTAIAHGAAWVPDARVQNAVPYDLAVIAGPETLLTLPRNQSQDVMPRSRIYQVPPGLPLIIVLQADVNGEKHRVGEGQILNPYDRTSRIEIWTSLQNGKLSLTYCHLNPTNPAEKSEMQPLLEYTL